MKQTREQYNAKKRELYWRNIEKRRKYARDSKRRQRARRADEINSYQREWYAKHADEAKKQNKRRLRRRPYQGLRAAIFNCERGNLDLAGLIELFRERLAWSDGKNGSTR